MAIILGVNGWEYLRNRGSFESQRLLFEMKFMKLFLELYFLKIKQNKNWKLLFWLFLKKARGMRIWKKRFEKNGGWIYEIYSDFSYPISPQWPRSHTPHKGISFLKNLWKKIIGECEVVEINKKKWKRKARNDGVSEMWWLVLSHSPKGLAATMKFLIEK